jgi:hypothetical protein
MRLPGRLRVDRRRFIASIAGTVANISTSEIENSGAILSAAKNPEGDGCMIQANILWTLHSAALRSG